MKILTPIKSIRKHCIDCCNGSRNEVKLCESGSTVPACPLWPYRMGKDPKRKGIGKSAEYLASIKPKHHVS